MRGLYRLTYAANKQAAINDWAFLAQFAQVNGHADLAAELLPKPNAGIKAIDRQIGRLRQALTEAGLAVPGLPSRGSLTTEQETTNDNP